MRELKLKWKVETCETTKTKFFQIIFEADSFCHISSLLALPGVTGHIKSLISIIIQKDSNLDDTVDLSRQKLHFVFKF